MPDQPGADGADPVNSDTVPALGRMWLDAIPDDVPALLDGASAGTDYSAVLARVDDASAGTEWRIEVVRGGKFWQWRKGRNGTRVSRYGGKFDTLSTERQSAYYDNRKRWARTKTTTTTITR